MLEPRIENLSEITLVGKKTRMSLVENKTAALWQSFMPRKREIENVQGPNLYSVEVYDSLDYFRNFDFHNTYTKWAAVKVLTTLNIPKEMEILQIPEGTYATFHYKGKASEVGKMYQEILTKWLASSKYALDNRPHFAVMGEKYKNEHPDSEEELWIPVKLKQ